MFFALAKKELQALSRDVHGLAALFLMPMVFIIVMSMALKDVYTPKVQALRYAVVNQDGSPSAQALLQAWSKDHGAAVTPTPSDWESAITAGRALRVFALSPVMMIAPESTACGAIPAARY